MAAAHTPNTLATEANGIRRELAVIEAAIAAHAAQFAEQQKTLKAAFAEKEKELIALGAGRYGSDQQHLVTVVDATPAKMSPDTFELRSKEDEEKARALADDEFLHLFDRHVFFTPKEDFRGLARGRLKPKKALDLIALCLVPGQLGGGRAAHLRWAEK